MRNRQWLPWLLAGVLSVMPALALAQAVPAASEPEASAYASVGDLRFEPNRGQFADAVDFYARGPRYAVALAEGRATLLLAEPVVPDAAAKVAAEDFVRLRPRDAVDDAQPARPPTATRWRAVTIAAAAAQLPEPGKAARPYATRNHYLNSASEAGWQRDVPIYAEVSYPGVYPGVDLVYYGKQGQLEFDFRVAPQADPSPIRLSISGADALRLDEHGDLRLKLGERELVQQAPVAYQLAADGRREARVARYVLAKDGKVGLKLGAYDRSRELVIDPVLTYSSYYGGSSGDNGIAVRTDAAGNLYLIGSTSSADLTTLGAYDASFSSQRVARTVYNYCPSCVDVVPPSETVARTYFSRGSELFVSKLSPNGQNILYSTYLGSGGNVSLLSNQTAVSPAGEVFFAFAIYDFNGPAAMPVVNAQASSGQGWAARLNAAGNGFVYASYYPYNFERGVAVDGNNQLVSGDSPQASAVWPTVNPLAGQSCSVGGGNMGIVRLSASGVVNFASCLGGSRTDNARAVAVDASGDMFIFGRTWSTNFPVVNGLPDAPTDSSYSLALARIDGSSLALEFSTRLFGLNFGRLFASDMVVDASGHVVIAGTIWGANLPVKNAFQPNIATPASSFLNDDFGDCYGSVVCDDSDYFLARINPLTPTVVFATYFGGRKSEPNIGKLAIDSAGYILLAGGTHSPDLPLRLPLQPAIGGKSDMFVARFSPLGRLNFSTFIGGAQGEAMVNQQVGVTGAPNGMIWLSSNTESANFPVTAGALKPTLSGGLDATLVGITLSGLTDGDGDGVPDAADFAPANAAEWNDNDGDGTGDNADADDDNDGVVDTADRFVFNAAESQDSDGDGKGNVGDRFPNDRLDMYDLDNDGIGDNSDTDADNDGVLNDYSGAINDSFPLNAAEYADTDFDGIGDNADPDRDGDGLANGADLAPLDPNEPLITFTGYSVSATSVFLRPLPPAFDAIYAWNRTWTEARDSSPQGDGIDQSMTSPVLPDGQISGVKLKTCETSQVSFDLRVSSAAGDRFQFVVDGNVLLDLDGQHAWAPRTFNLTPGHHELRWLYSKNASGSAGLDAAWIDNINLHQPPSCIFDSGFD